MLLRSSLEGVEGEGRIGAMVMLIALGIQLLTRPGVVLEGIF